MVTFFRCPKHACNVALIHRCNDRFRVKDNRNVRVQTEIINPEIGEETDLIDLQVLHGYDETLSTDSG